MDERASSRVATETTVECSAAEERFLARLWNLSTDGCMVQFVGRGLAEANELEIKFDVGITAAGCVAWRRGSYAGVRFSRQIHQAAVRHLDLAKLCPKTWFELPNLPHPLLGVPLE